ncbi:hypothetical protein [Bradyrhizobium sp. CCBAU 51753]|uniref:hypothetical protein n=1 Tax=Bradyrhizobium sp. CCBAU 51753 TaxID=1325100 RepID=UPI00188BAC1C|nr:hypothetical protein [Bradyrhizobium sp. CCBAU 51753]QOZ26125.1 hypothetical protein XH93_22890 [Bradyrhizobium sp. CCBAU 51753]
MPLHRDIHWLGRQWAVTGHGLQLINQKQMGYYDIEVARLWEPGVIEAMQSKAWINRADFDKAVEVARGKFAHTAPADYQPAVAPAVAPMPPAAPPVTRAPAELPAGPSLEELLAKLKARSAASAPAAQPADAPVAAPPEAERSNPTSESLEPELSKPELAKPERATSEPAHALKPEPANAELRPIVQAKPEPPKPELPKPEAAESEPAESEPAKLHKLTLRPFAQVGLEPPKAEPSKADPLKADPPKIEPSKPEPSQPEPRQAEPPKSEQPQTAAAEANSRRPVPIPIRIVRPSGPPKPILPVFSRKIAGSARFVSPWRARWISPGLPPRP